ncbi:hypothetical protein Clacol_009848 [Clathrus columnatus]|uniref:ATP-cone domain-containing protein n=1 Tax=Clathrus columnatus TaxID=1419009 RepID=A0AAV5AMC9_9AGAM|nr:hypothetical protein Clacol_009848 [Clathrus columnatus]
MKERVAFDKITSRINKLYYGLDTDHIEPVEITRAYGSILLVIIDILAAETAACLTTSHPDYAILAARIAISNLHKETEKKFSEVIEDLYRYINPKNGRPASMISDFTYEAVRKNVELLDSAIVYNRDFDYN